MAHEIAMVGGQASFAYRGEKGWHGLGQAIEAGDTKADILRKGGMDYKIQRGYVRYATTRDATAEQYRKVEDRVVQFRSDNGADLGIVSDSFETVQPETVFDMVDQWTKAGGAQLETIGALFGGRRYFATARIGEAVSVGGKDLLLPYVGIWTACDGSLATEVSWHSVRIVCNNTLSMARAETAGKTHRVTHRSKFSIIGARDFIESANAEFGAFMETARELSRVKVSAQVARELTAKLLKAADVEAAAEQRAFGKILALFDGAGAGAEMATASGTAWGWLNAVTDYVDHGVKAKSAEHRLASSQTGPGAALKARAVELLTA